MKLSPPITILTIVAASIVWLGLVRPEPVHDDQAQGCDVALTYLKHIESTKQKPLLVSDAPWRVLSTEQLELALKNDPKLQDHVDFEIWQRAASLNGLSAIKPCQNVREWLAAKGIEILTEHQTEVRLRPYEEYPWQAILISMPVVSRDGKKAFFEASIHYGKLAGGSYAVEMRRHADGSWHIFDEVGTGVS